MLCVQQLEQKAVGTARLSRFYHWLNITTVLDHCPGVWTEFDFQLLDAMDWKFGTILLLSRQLLVEVKSKRDEKL